MSATATQRHKKDPRLGGSSSCPVFPRLSDDTKDLVRPRRLELPRCYPLAPQASASTNSATAALVRSAGWERSDGRETPTAEPRAGDSKSTAAGQGACDGAPGGGPASERPYSGA